MSGIIGAIGFMLIIIVVGLTFITFTRYKDVDSLLNVEDTRVVTIEGKVSYITVDSSKDLVLFVLEGKSGHKVLAYYSLSKFLSEFGGPPSHQTVESKIVITGTYIPRKTAGDIIGEIEIKSILSGCHKAYEAPPVKTK